MESKLRIGVVLFDGFELLDVFGPLEFFLSEKRLFDSVMLAEVSGRVESLPNISGTPTQAGTPSRKSTDCCRIEET